MEASKVTQSRKITVSAAILVTIAGLSLALGFAWAALRPIAAFGAEPRLTKKSAAETVPAKKTKSQKILYPEKTELDFEGTQIEGELRNPGEFYFQHRNEEKFDSLVKRRKNFHREMLRDVVLSR